MRSLVLSVCVLVCPLLLAQPECRQASGGPAEVHEGYRTANVLLPAQPRAVTATAVLPEKNGGKGAFVFSLSSLVTTEPDRVIEVLPVAIELAKAGHAAIVVERKLTWPLIDESVGQWQAASLCAEQWLSTHAAVKADDWAFVGPRADDPTFAQLYATGDTKSMTFYSGMLMGGTNEDKNTDAVLQHGLRQYVLSGSGDPQAAETGAPGPATP